MPDTRTEPQTARSFIAALLSSPAWPQDEDIPVPRHILAAALRDTPESPPTGPRLRLTGEQMDSIQPPIGPEWQVDWDEYAEFVRVSDAEEGATDAK